jgi:hypothetical protein
MEDDAIRGLTVIKDGEITWPPPAPKLPPRRRGQARRRGAAKKGHGHGAASEPMAGNKLAIMFGVAARCSGCRRQRAGGLPRPLHGLRAGLLRRLHGGLERDARRCTRR